MIRSFSEVENAAYEAGTKKASVLRAENKEFLLALKEACGRGYIEPILIGNEPEIRKIADEIEFDISSFQLIDENDPQEIADRGVNLVSTGEAQFVFRGHIEGHFLYRALIRSSSNSNINKQVCAVTLIYLPVLPKLIGMTDGGVAIAPDYQSKIEIIRNTVDLFSHLGYDNPRVGVLTAERGLNPELGSVRDSVKIKEASVNGELKGCSIQDGLGISDFLFGKDGFLEESDKIDFSLIPDIFLVHNVEFGNIFSKIDSLSTEDYFSGWERHGIITGAGIPTVVPSRADKHNTIVTDIALGVLIAREEEATGNDA